MCETWTRKKTFNFMIGKKELLKLRLRAIRAGVWFQALRRIDRAIINLTIQVTSKVRSFTLAQKIFSIIKRLEGKLESRVSRAVKEVGFQLAQKISLVAQKWGNTSAKDWGSDISFAKFLAVIHINNPGVSIL